MTIYSGDEFYGDDITSGQFDDEREQIEAEYDALSSALDDEDERR